MQQGPKGHGARVSTHPDRLHVFREVCVPDSASWKYKFHVICLERQRGLSEACGPHKRYGKRYGKGCGKRYRKRDRENRSGDIFAGDSIDRGVNNDRM